MRDRVENWIKDWFSHRGKLGKVTNASLTEIDYFEAGWLTSMEVVEFVTDIENQFGIQFSDRELQDSRFITIAGLTALILECSTGCSTEDSTKISEIC